jgi:prevent-host-death family protein
METVNVAEASERLAELVARVAAGERIVISNQEQPVAALISAIELERLERVSPSTVQLALSAGQSAELLNHIHTGQLHPLMAAFGLWRGESEFDGLENSIYANRRHQSSRAEVGW